MKREKLTQDQVDALSRMIGRVGKMMHALDKVDLSAGRGVLDGSNRCIWTKDGKRITISIGPERELCVSTNGGRDPEYKPNFEEGT